MSSFVFEVAKRFRQPTQQDSYISFVSGASTAGIGLGCAVLILLLSVMNGFEYELRNTLLNVVPHAEIYALDGQSFEPEPEFISVLKDDPRVDNVFLLNKAYGLLQYGKKMKAISLVGADESYFTEKFAKAKGNKAITDTSKTTTLSTSDLYQNLSSQADGILLGKTIMQEQNIKLGDKVQILLPANTQDLSFSAPKSAWLTVVGSLSVGGELDNILGVLNQQFMSDLLEHPGQLTHIEIKLNDPFEAYSLVREYGFKFPQAAYMSDWTRTNGHLYQDIQLIRTVVYIVLALVIAVACFNIVSALVMSVKEKSKEIAILKTIGASNRNIATIFIYKGLYHGLKGAFIGTIVGVLLALYLEQVISVLEILLGSKILSADIYFTAGIPSKLAWLDVVTTTVIVVLISVLATLYPAKQAANIQPAANLH